jgi:tetratricopeptide (TPR) repeat protein
MAVSATKNRQAPEVTRKGRLRIRRVRLWAIVLALLAVAVWQGPTWLAAYPKWKARRAIAAGKLKAGQEWLALARRVNANDAETVFLEARILRKQGDFTRFREQLQRARELGFSLDRLQREQWLAWAQSGQLRLAEPHLSALLQKPQGDGPEICEAFANGFFRSHRIPEAVRILTAWIADFPDDPRPYFSRGRIRASQRSWKEAERDFRQTLKLDAGHFEAACQLGRVLAKQKHLKEAIDYFELCEAGPRVRTSGRIGQAACWRMLGEPGKARAILNRLLTEQPGLAAALFEIGQLDLDSGRYDTAVNVLNAAYERSPRDLSIRYALGRALRGAGRLKQAESHLAFVSAAREALARAQRLEERVAAHPQDVAARYEIGVIHLKYGLPDSGVVWLLSALDYAPTHQPTHKALAAYYDRRAREDPSFAKLAERHRSQIDDR